MISLGVSSIKVQRPIWGNALNS